MRERNLGRKADGVKPLLRQAVEESGACVKAVAAACDRHYGYLADALNDTRAQELTAADLVPFMRATNLIPLRWLCHQFGGVFMPLPVVPAGQQDIRDRFLHAVEEVGRDSAAIQRAMADGVMTDIEGRDLVAELENTIQVFSEVIALVQQSRQRPTPARMTLPQAPDTQARRRA